MAGIYIPDIEMPIGHNEATFGIDADGHPLLAVYTENNPDPEIYYIIPVPDHGRLGDLDAMAERARQAAAKAEKEQFYDGELWYPVIAKWAEIEPTIIPADKEGI